MEDEPIDLKMILYAILATEAQQRGQPNAANRLLVVAGYAACHAGWLDVAVRCRQHVLTNNSHHWLRRYASMPAAIRDSAETRSLFRQAAAICTFEEAEFHVIQQLGLHSRVDELLADPGPRTLAFLSTRPWPDMEGSLG